MRGLRANQVRGLRANQVRVAGAGQRGCEKRKASCPRAASRRTESASHLEILLERVDEEARQVRERGVVGRVVPPRLCGLELIVGYPGALDGHLWGGVGCFLVVWVWVVWGLALGKRGLGEAWGGGDNGSSCVWRS